ncbi:hypothetical protein [Archangium sp.]|uniref:hypothetical protein n=1 Tax=Archangium sp. TaxID=1872627 RepID=UPI002D40D2C7|nr:hypothetical protein [Archangium sp.]HYO57933.1 hypothetical protein [Archangium sp.]
MEMTDKTELLLPDLPNEEPWFELKFQIHELAWDLQRVLERLKALELQLGIKAGVLRLVMALGQIHDEIDHDARAHAPRAVLLARHLLDSPTESVPEWDFEHGSDNTFSPEILACRSLVEAQTRMTLHMEETSSAVYRAHQALLRALDVRGPVRSVLEHVLQQATLCQQILQGPAWEHSRDARRWAEPYWRLMDP